MIITRTDYPIKRFFIHSLMIFLVVLALVPIYMVLLTSTRTAEQINSGLAMFPGRDAFFSSTHTIIADWGNEEATDGIHEDAYGYEVVIEADASANLEVTVGTVRYLNLVMDTQNPTLREEVNSETGEIERRVIRSRTESRIPRIVIVDEEGARLVAYNLSDNATLFVTDGQRIERGTVIARLITPSNVAYNWRALTGRGFQIWQGFGNSAFIAICTTLLSVYFSALTAYGLHVYRFRGRIAIWAVILIIMMLPGSLTFIGFVQLMSRWRLTDTYIPLIIPGIAAAATVLFIRQYMMSILSFEMIDAARIDGASEYRIFNTVIIPVIVPALAAQSIFTFVGSWNNFLTPFVIISTQSRYTLPMLVQALRGDIYRTEVGGIYLGIAVSLIPILIFYSFMSRFIISGLTMGGIKE
jgi:multiple sugar transport system permease protein